MNGRGRRRPARPDLWQHQGGGCVVGRMAKPLEHPCDDEYENVETGEVAILRSTEAAHGAMPDEASCVRDLAARPGVVLEWRGWREDD